jgi:hypothetical protein
MIKQIVSLLGQNQKPMELGPWIDFPESTTIGTFSTIEGTGDWCGRTSCVSKIQSALSQIGRFDWKGTARCKHGAWVWCDPTEWLRLVSHVKDIAMEKVS